MTIQELKDYLCVDDDTQDSMIESLYDAAVKFCQDATGKPYSDDNQLYGLLIKMLVSHWYDSRGAVAGNQHEVPYTVSCLLNHIAMTGGGSNV